MSYVKIWIHAVCTTKKREPRIKENIRKSLFDHIQQNGVGKKILIEVVGGHHNHVHCLFRLKNNQTIEKYGFKVFNG